MQVILLMCGQAARTYLERKFEEFEGCSLDQLIRHSLQVRLHMLLPVIHKCVVAATQEFQCFTAVQQHQLIVKRLRYSLLSLRTFVACHSTG